MRIDDPNFFIATILNVGLFLILPNLVIFLEEKIFHSGLTRQKISGLMNRYKESGVIGKALVQLGLALLWALSFALISFYVGK